MVDDDGRTDAGRTPDHGHPISSPCEPNGSGELKKTDFYKIFLRALSRESKDARTKRQIIMQ